MRFTPTFSALLVSVLATASSVAAGTISQKVVFSATGVSDVTAKSDGCNTIVPDGVSQIACVKHVFSDGFTMSVRNIPNTPELFCAISGTSGTCGPNSVKATVDLTGGTGTAPCATDPKGSPKSDFSAADLSSSPIASSGSGAAKAGSTAKASKSTAAKSSSSSAKAKSSSTKSKSSAAIPQKVTFAAGAGSAAVTAKPDGCASVTANGVKQTACVKHVFTDGFTMSVRGIPNTPELFCAIAGTTGTCGPDAVEATVDLTGGTGTAPAATNPAGSPKSDFKAADISSKPIAASGSGAANATSAAKSAKSAKSSAPAKSSSKAAIPQKVTFSAGAGSAAVTAKPDGCASVTANGVKQTACVKHVFTDGFTMSVRGIPNTPELFCAISGTTGTCGPDAVEATVDLTGGTGTAPAATNPAGSPKSDFKAADISSKPITRRHARDFHRA